MSFLSLWQDIYDTRVQFLKASDWTQLPDSPLSEEEKNEWAVYRQALRDIPEKWPPDVDKATVNPLDTPSIFPEKPSDVA